MQLEAPKRMLLLAEFSKRMRISDTTGRRWIVSGKVRSLKVGHKHLIPESEVERLLAAAESQGGK